LATQALAVNESSITPMRNIPLLRRQQPAARELFRFRPLSIAAAPSEGTGLTEGLQS
jgi:hypothetical protein